MYEMEAYQACQYAPPMSVEVNSADDIDSVLAAFALCKMSKEVEPVKRCQLCGATKTPLWRRNSRYSMLCNACGLWLKTHM